MAVVFWLDELLSEECVMRKRSPFSRKEFSRFGLIAVAVIAFGAVVTELYYHPLETIGAIVVVMAILSLVGILNKTADNVERARNWRKPKGLNEVLSFSIEKEIKEANNRVLSFNREKESEK